MSLVPQSFLDQLLQRVDLHEIVGQRVQLKKQGKDYGGLCPFHTEKSPSFTISAAKQFYHCFGCGAHGTAITFLMEYDGLGFRDAVEQLAQNAGMSVPSEGIEPLVQSTAQRKVNEVLAWNDRAARVFLRNLIAYPDAVTYLKNRGLVRETILKFGIGYAGRDLRDQFPDVEVPDLIEAGLLVEHERRGRIVVEDKFRDRVMFPIQNERGSVVGFGGRVLDGREPKYLNSAENMVFSKGDELYGLVHAKAEIRKHAAAVVVEGYMDVVMLHQHGECRAVASLGTSLTESQVRRLFRLADEIVFCFDGDKAGKKAAERAAILILPYLVDGKQATFSVLPDEHDPDSYIQEVGIAAWREWIVTEGLPLSEMIWAMLSANGANSSPESKTRLALRATQVLSEISDAAATYKEAFRRLIEERVGQALPHRRATAMKRASSDLRENDVAAIVPDPNILNFYENYALLCCLNIERAAVVPRDMIDDFAALIASWFAVAPVDGAARLAACTKLPGGPLKRLLIASLRRAGERLSLLGDQAVSSEAEAALWAIGRKVLQQKKSSSVLHLFN